MREEFVFQIANQKRPACSFIFIQLYSRISCTASNPVSPTL